MVYLGKWEVDWEKGRGPNQGVWARNLGSRFPKGREWNWRRIDFLTKKGLAVPRFGTDWEVDWSKRRGESVWARNPTSKRLEAREWRWVSKGTLITGGVKWVSSVDGRHLNSHGYWMLSKNAMTEEEVAMCERAGIFQGRNGRQPRVMEHRLVALKKYGHIPKGNVVRHINGDKQDNRPENLILGTHKENHTDHKNAVIQMMIWRERAEAAEKKLREAGIEA